ncbi:MAG: phosphodiester glycosidase family protein [Candidatus Coprovivens sp.]
MSEIKFLKPFTRFCMTIGNLPSSYLISMTYEEQLLWLCDYLEKTVIPTINNNSEATKEIQELFNQLKNYVDHYFDNLDVQEEINNKLDEMAQDGILQQIISSYLETNAILSFNTKEDLKNSTNLLNGSFVRIFGKLKYNDGLGSFYKIREFNISDTIDDNLIIRLINTNNLIAEKIVDNNFVYSTMTNEIKLESAYSSQIECYYHLIKIPRKNFTFTQILNNNTFSNGIYNYLKNKSNKIYINGQLKGACVINGQLAEESYINQEPWYYFGIDINGNFKYTKDINHLLTAQDLINNGYYQAFGIWHPILINNVPFIPANELPQSDPNFNYIINRKHTRTILGYDDNYFYLLTIEGRLPRSIGIDFNGEVAICRELNIPYAFNLDGGGSTQLWCTNPPFNFVISDSSDYKSGYSSRNVYGLLEFFKKGE